MEAKKSKLKPEFKLSKDFLDLRNIDTNVLVNYLEEQIKLREMSVEKKLKKNKIFITKQ